MKTLVNSLLIIAVLCSLNGNIITPAYGRLNQKEVSSPPAYEIRRDVVMRTQGNNKTSVDNNVILLSDFQLSGTCTFNKNEKKIALLAYYSSRGVSLYSPSNATNIIKNYRCNGASYEALIAPVEWTATRFRVLLPSNKKQRAVYEAFNSDNSGKFSSDLLKGIPAPSSSAIRYSASDTPASNIFNTTDAYLIWAQIPTENGSVDVLIHMKDVTENKNLSTLKFDLAVPRN